MAEPLTTPTSQTGTLGGKATLGVVLSFFQSILGRVLLLLSQLILAKLLIPEDFGVFGLASTLSLLFGTLTSTGIDQILQQRRDRMHFWTTQALTISLGLSTLAALGMLALAPLGAKLYHTEELVIIVSILALNLPVTALCAPPEARLKMELRYKFLVAYGSTELLLTQILTIGMAWQGMGALSFALPTLIASIIKVAVFWSLAPVRLRPLRACKGWRPLLNRSSAAFGSTLINTSIAQGDYAILGLIASTHIVGVYFFAFRLAAQPVRMLSSNFIWALKPALISISREPDRQVQIALKTAQLLGLITVPVCYLQAAVAEPGLIFLFGDRWSEAIPLIQILSLTLPFDAISWIAGALLEARGQYNRVMKLLLISAPLFFGLVIAGALTGSAKNVAIAVAIYYLLHPMIFTTLVFLREKLPLRRVLSCFAMPALLGLPTIGGTAYLSLMPWLTPYPLGQIGFTLSVGSLAYLMAIRLFLPEMYTELRTKIIGLLKKGYSRKR